MEKLVHADWKNIAAVTAKVRKKIKLCIINELKKNREVLQIWNYVRKTYALLGKI